MIRCVLEIEVQRVVRSERVLSSRVEVFTQTGFLDRRIERAVTGDGADRVGVELVVALCQQRQAQLALDQRTADCRLIVLPRIWQLDGSESVPRVQGIVAQIEIEI